jgi:hypothetical protein
MDEDFDDDDPDLELCRCCGDLFPPRALTKCKECDLNFCEEDLESHRCCSEYFNPREN